MSDPWMVEYKDEFVRFLPPREDEHDCRFNDLRVQVERHLDGWRWQVDEATIEVLTPDMLGIEWEKLGEGTATGPEEAKAQAMRWVEENEPDALEEG